MVQSAIATIKNNRNLLSRRKRLKNTLAGKEGAKFETKAPNAGSYELKKLKKKLLAEHRIIELKQKIIVGIIMLFIISIFIYYL